MCNCDNPYIPSPAKIIDIIKHTDIELSLIHIYKSLPFHFLSMS